MEDTTKIIKNGHEFARDWKRYCKTNTDRYNFLIKIGGEQLGVIFKMEIAFGLLGDILVALEECFVPEDANAIVSILENLSKTSRFTLSLDFLSSIEKDSCQRLLLKLQCLCMAAASDVTYSFSDNSVQTLMEVYKVS
uniref:Coiled-coil domain-containing protein 103-like n=1 Tax=Saccoglossus kowalevskii TaxID=10224 RepID=A0ABM0N0Q9_SACKO|nr:PREDICTED: coiled-coil domain-containing protein 103-like [Saccoglossus kowalevskii]